MRSLAIAIKFIVSLIYGRRPIHLLLPQTAWRTWVARWNHYCHSIEPFLGCLHYIAVLYWSLGYCVLILGYRIVKVFAPRKLTLANSYYS